MGEKCKKCTAILWPPYVNVTTNNVVVLFMGDVNQPGDRQHNNLGGKNS